MVDTISILIRTPDFLSGSYETKEKLKESYEIKKIVYDKIYPEISWKINLSNSLLLDKLPTRLYSIKIGKVEEINKNSQIKNYATLSYVWGGSYNTESGELSPGGRKSLKKAIEACQYLDIDYLWIDQLCIDQRNNEDKSREVPKMRDYYSNSAVTLIAIQTEVGERKKHYLDLEENDKEISTGGSHRNTLEMICKSEWFSRSWTYQEGLLSKNTIFMFDDILIDGRFMASMWEAEQYLNRLIFYTSLRDFCESKGEKTATPLGWVYHKEGYKEDDVANLSLSEALRETKTRKRTLPIDGIYSVVGLLPYGKDININYSLTSEQALVEVMKAAAKNGYADPLTWHGPTNNLPALCWLPEIDSNGSVKIEGGLEISCVPKSVNFTEKGIEIIGTEYIIDSVVEEIRSTDGNHTVDGNLYDREVKVEVGNKHEMITLSGTMRMLCEIVPGKVLLVPNKEQWKCDEGYDFAILASKEDRSYHRIDIARIMQKVDAEKLIGKEEKKLLIGIKKEFVDFQQYQANIEQLTK